MWIHHINQGSEELDEYYALVEEVWNFQERLYRYVHMDVVWFEEVLKLV